MRHRVGRIGSDGSDLVAASEVEPFALFFLLPFSFLPASGASRRAINFSHLARHRDEQPDAPVLLIKWYDWVKWVLERVDSFPKNQRFIFGQRLADRAIGVLELLVEAAYSPRKADLLARANRQVEVLRWLVRLAKDRGLLTVRQYGFACKGLTDCGRMLGGWLKQAAAKERAARAPAPPPF